MLNVSIVVKRATILLTAPSQEKMTMNSQTWYPVKLLPLPQPPLRARTDARTNRSAQRATQLRSVLTRVYAVARQNQITTNVP
jgi:hypothetical protein